ncbi:hypothetical protein [Aliagarivorans marinus]|uniref:hypothetical protein n=1 Tax=Aliagarivorans marinus TaxID=561965 RepID=UPI00041B1CE4|nr:hypothetical protein [Aliagarivorans marinus]
MSKIWLSVVAVLLSISAYADVLCLPDETPSFACGFSTKHVAVCRKGDERLVYRFGSKQHLELELQADVHFSRTAYSGGGEGNLTFENGAYKYIVYSSISNGDWLDDGSRAKIERAGIYVVKNDQLLADIACQTFPDKHFIHSLPPFEEQPFRFYH